MATALTKSKESFFAPHTRLQAMHMKQGKYEDYHDTSLIIQLARSHGHQFNDKSCYCRSLEF
jgi:hypothetical protein